MSLINRINYFYNILKYADEDSGYGELSSAFRYMHLLTEKDYMEKLKKWVKDNNVESFFPFKSLKYDRYLISKFKFNLDVDRISPFQESYDDDTIYVISLVKLNIVPENNDVSSSSLTESFFEKYVIPENSLEIKVCSGFKNSPQIYIYKFDMIDKKVSTQISKEVGSDAFIVQTLRKFFPFISNESIINFYEENKAKINSLKRPPIFTMSPKLLGGGADGVAFKIGESYVLKLFTSRFAFLTSVEQLQSLHKADEFAGVEVMLYDAGVLGYCYPYDNLDDKRPIYYYIMELVKTFDEIKDRQIVQRIDLFARRVVDNILYRQLRRQDVKDIKQYLIDGDRKDSIMNQKVKDFMNEMYNQAEDIVREDGYTMRDLTDYTMFCFEKSGVKLQPDFMEKFIEEIVIKALTGRVDFHYGNLGITNNGYIKCFDPAYMGNR